MQLKSRVFSLFGWRNFQLYHLFYKWCGFYLWQKKRVSNKFKINKYSILILLLLLPPLLQLLVIIIILIIMIIVIIIMVSKGFEKFEENGR